MVIFYRLRLERAVFILETLGKIKDTIDRFSLIAPGDRILVALSGGPDSVALLNILYSLKEQCKISLAAAYINHKIRPRAAKKEIFFCSQICHKLEAPFFQDEINIPKLSLQEKTATEETGRKYRYQALQQIAKENGYNKIATGHHRDDRVETILFNLARGTSRNGMIGFQSFRDNIIRPLYDVSREEIIEYLDSKKIGFLIDRSNASSRYTRNRIRNRLMKLIEKDISSSAGDNIIRFSEILREEERFLDKYTSKLFGKLHAVTPGGKNTLDLKNKLDYDVWLQRRLVVHLLKHCGIEEIDYALVERLIKKIKTGKSGKIQISAELYADYLNEKFFIFGPEREIKSLNIDIPGRYDLDYPGIWIKFEYTGEGEDIERYQSDKSVACIDAENIRLPLNIEGLKRGLRFHPYGRPGRKKARDFLTDIKYSRPLRDELPVLYDNEGVVWLAGIEIDQRFAITKQTRKILKIEIGRR
ncbi:MAG: tRNA lysidine(34) synthetase TilS [Candidatus Zixiibacteriota bacterium]